MGEVREGWALAYVYTYAADRRKFCGVTGYMGREAAHAYARTAPDRNRFMVHARLKPEGAPRRYASETEKRAWDIDPAGARFAAEHGFSLRNRAGKGVYLVPSRTPKIEESAS